MKTAAFFLILLFILDQGRSRSIIRRPEAREQITVIEVQEKKQALPVRLKILKLNIDAFVESVGLTSGGEMEVPKDTADVGWFNLGPRPGERGSAVIAGHFDNKNGGPGVFANLYKLKPGDELSVEDNEGIVTTFIVRESRLYDLGFAEEVFSSGDGINLNLVTCDGVWDGVRKSYSKRLVVFTDIIMQN